MIQLKIDSTAIASRLKELGETRQGPFILSRTLNLLAKKIQDAEREDFRLFLKLRREPWVTSQVKINKGNWATKRKLVVRIELSDEAGFLGILDRGGERLPVLGRRYLALPNSKVFGKKVIGRDNPLRIKNLQLHQTPFGTRGLERTFMINSAKGTPLIMQRTGNDERGKKSRKEGSLQYMSGLRLLYTLVKTAHMPRKLHWFTVANSVVTNDQSSITREVISQAMKSTRA